MLLMCVVLFHLCFYVVLLCVILRVCFDLLPLCLFFLCMCIMSVFDFVLFLCVSYSLPCSSAFSFPASASSSYSSSDHGCLGG